MKTSVYNFNSEACRELKVRYACCDASPKSLTIGNL